MENGTKLLEGIRVIDLSRFVSGPYCTMLMGDMGADVIKIEHPVTGDGTRRWGMQGLGMDNPYFLSVNRSKRSVAVDIKNKRGRDVIEALVMQADVVITNAKYGSLEAAGLGYERLRAGNPGLVYCEITGFGGHGPYRDRPAFDFPTQAQSGLMSVIGEPDGAPMKIGVPMIDIMTAMQAFGGIQAALVQRARTGEGTKISTSLLETALASMTNVISDYINEGVEPERWGNGHPNLAPYAAYRAADGWITVGVATEGQWKQFCGVIGRPDLAEDPRFATNQARLGHRRELDEAIAPAVLAKSKHACLEALQDRGVPCAPLNTVPEIMADPHVREIGMVAELPHPTLGEVKMIRSAISVEDQPIQITLRPPTFGEHTDEVLRDLLNLDDTEIAALREAKAIR
jgi:crotonobetainyl-CoA:carnitine CoA-transferase CaiB-like acyl-CoA transferase